MDEKTERSLEEELYALEDLAVKIESGATGFELALEAENNNNLPQLYFNGIYFIETFKKIGEKVFIESPDEIVKDYTSFKVKEETEKSIFMKWLHREIEERRAKLYPKKEYLQFKKMMEKKEMVKNIKFCPDCGARITDITQKYCEQCGKQLL
ncbi:MAG: zinc ribbon domain-containing protein [Promethearchaeota archaeon]